MTVENIFVYGTLKPGFDNWPLLEDRVWSFQEAELTQAKLYGTPSSGFPFMLPSNNSSDIVRGVVCNIKPEEREGVLSDLDWLEGYPSLFNRDYFSVRIIQTGARINAMAYYFADPGAANVVPVIENGEWK